jgi:DNA invertase Pin-like site-specific DNA recombinase
MKRQASPTTHAIGYVRVSTDDQSLRPEAQRACITTWAQRRGLTLVNIYEDGAISSGTPLDKRHVLLEAIEALYPGYVLVATKRDCIARDAITVAMVERLAEKVGAKLRTCDGASDGDTPEAKRMRTMIDALAEYERAMMRLRTKTALQHKKSKRERVGTVRYGYTLASDGIHLEISTHEQAIISRAKSLHAQGFSSRAIAKKLEAQGYLSRAGKAFVPAAIINMVSRN